jgi:membrane associated rhomboid family serine protease
MPLRITRAVKILLIACFAAFIVQMTADQFFGAGLLQIFGLIPSGIVIQHRLWQLFTYSFLHADPMHLFLNLMMLAFIGGELESAWGTPRFLRYYFFCTVCAGLLYLLIELILAWRGDGTGAVASLHQPMVGASGAIYGLLVAYGMIFGERVLLFMLLFPMKAKHFVWILAAIEFMTTVFSPHGGLASAAHLGGMAAGFCYLWGGAFLIVNRNRRRERAGKARPRKRPSHLRLVISNPKDFETDDDADREPPTWH